MQKKVLIIRLSSLGDIIQCLPAADFIKENWPDCQLHWWVKSDFASSLKNTSSIDQLHVFDKKKGFIGFLKMSWRLRREQFTHIYDAHSNIRSHLASIILRFPFYNTHFIRRSKNRIQRWLLFQFHWNFLPQPFRGAESFISPLKKWGLIQNKWPQSSTHISPSIKTQKIIEKNQLTKGFTLIAPSAAWELKRWPIEHWIELIKQNPERTFVIVGGPQDQFCDEISANNKNAVNLSGQLNWDETFEIVQLANQVISGDTGVLHMSDYLQKPTLALIGPTAFGFPSSPHSITLELDLPCRPCSKDGRGKCRNEVYKKCLVELKPKMVSEKLNESVAR